MIRYLEGIALLLAALVPLHSASYLWRVRLLGEWSGAVARLAEIMTDLTVFICVSEILGSLHLYRIAPMVIGVDRSRGHWHRDSTSGGSGFLAGG